MPEETGWHGCYFRVKIVNIPWKRKGLWNPETKTLLILLNSTL